MAKDKKDSKVKKTPTPRSDAQMRCRAAGCRCRSKGPRFYYLCEKHIDVKVELKKQARKSKAKAKKS